MDWSCQGSPKRLLVDVDLGHGQFDGFTPARSRMKLALILSAILVSPAAAVAAEMSLLARIEYTGHDDPGGFQFQPPAGLSALSAPPCHIFLAGNQDRIAYWKVPALPENYGQTLRADATLLSDFNAALTRPVFAGMAIGFAGSISTYFDVDDIFNGTYNEFSSPYARAFVPKKGPAFTGYQLDELTMTVWESLQVVEIFGHAIPEPASAMIAMSLLCGWLVHRRRRQ
jgi:hypothetical protein